MLEEMLAAQSIEASREMGSISASKFAAPNLRQGSAEVSC
jgi:hypothetical protein